MHATTFVHACECHHQKHVFRLSVWFYAALEPSVYLLERPTARNDLLDGILNDERERGNFCWWCMEIVSWSCRHMQDQRNGVQVRKVIWRLFDIWPTAEAAAGATDDTLVIVEKLIQPLGLFRKRTIAIKRFSQEYLEAEVRCVCMTYSIMDCGRPCDADSCCVAEGSTCNHSNVHPLRTLCIRVPVRFKQEGEKGMAMLSAVVSSSP